jgi:hypothetical protein
MYFDLGDILFHPQDDGFYSSHSNDGTCFTPGG